MKVVINKCFGGFGLSREAVDLYAKAKDLKVGKWNKTWEHYDSGDFYDREIPRDDPVLVQIVEQLGEKASGNYAKLQIVNIPDDVNWQIEEYDGNEWISEVHQTWG